MSARETITVRRIDERNKNDVKLPNEPFPLFGRMIPTYDGGRWSYTTETFEPADCREITFPDEDYDFSAMKEEHFFVGAYDAAEKCVGLAVYKRYWFKYLYLEDLKVASSMRQKGVGGMLLEEGVKLARENGYNGLYTIGQDNNLGACLFYVKHGFEIGGLDTRVYRGTSLEGTSDIIFYRDN